MKKKAKNELKTMTITELDGKITKLQEELAKAQVERYTKQPKNVREHGTKRKQLAVMKTYRNEKQLLERQTHEQKESDK